MNLKTQKLKNYILSAVCFLAANMVVNAQPLVAGGQFMDLIQPMPGSVMSTSSDWGDVKSRWTDNGMEDAVRSYWGGNIVKGDDGRYHMYIAGWLENSSRGHATWSSGSRIYHIVADNPCGPYTYVSDIGAGHNPEIYKTGDTYVIYKISSLGYYKSKTLGDTWEKGEYEFDLRGRILIAGDNRETSLSNCTFAKRQDGSFVMMDRGGSVWISRDGLQDPWHQITDKTTYSGNRRYYEDPVIWRDHLQYHMIVNDWNARKAYYNRSLDGRTWIVEAGTAYSADETQYPRIFSVHADGTEERWHKYERPKVLQDNIGRAEYINFAVIDTEKSNDKGSDTHSSKNIVMPLIKPLVLEVLNSETITAGTTEIRVRVKAEAGFNPNTDLDLESLRFGAHGKVNYGNGFKVASSVADADDIIITFTGAFGESGITAAEFAPKMLGKKKDGSIAFGYAGLPYVDYKPAMLSALRPNVPVDGGNLTIDVTNYGLSASAQGSLKLYDADNALIGQADLAPVAPYETVTVDIAPKTTVKSRLSKFIAIFYSGNKEVVREEIPTTELTAAWDALQKEITAAKQLLASAVNGHEDLHTAVTDAEKYLASYSLTEIIATTERLISAVNSFKMSNASSSNGVSITIVNPSMDKIEPWTVLHVDANDPPGFKINANGANYGFTGNFMETWVSAVSALGRANYAWQSLGNMPAGRYRLKAKVIACRQSGSGGAAVEGVSIFLNDKHTPCATASGSAEEFSVIMWLEQAGELKFGLNIGASTIANWVAWDNVVLEYFGTDDGEISDTDNRMRFDPYVSYYFKNASSTAKQVYIQKPSLTSATDNHVYRTSSKTNAAELSIVDGAQEGYFLVRDVETGLYLSGKTANANGGQWTFDSLPTEVILSDNTSSKQSSWTLTGDAATFYLIGNGGDMYANAYKASSGDKVQSYRAADQGSQWYILSTGKTIDTGIAELAQSQGDMCYYTLSGTPVRNPRNGIFIECKANSIPRKIVVK